MVLSDDRKTTHLIPTWQDTMILESVNAALSPVVEFTDFMSGEKYVSISAMKPLMRHLEDILLQEKEEEPELTKNIKQHIFEYMEPKYSDPSIQDLLNLCTFLDPCFKFNYIKNDRLHDSTVGLIKGTIQQQIIDLIKKESRESEASEQHDNLPREAEQSSRPLKKKKASRDI